MTLSRLCARLGINRTTVYRHKETKTLLLVVYNMLRNDNFSLRKKKTLLYENLEEDMADDIWEHYIKHTYDLPYEEENGKDFERLSDIDIDELLGYGGGAK